MLSFIMDYFTWKEEDYEDGPQWDGRIGPLLVAFIAVVLMIAIVVSRYV